MNSLQPWDANHQESRWLEEGDVARGPGREHPCGIDEVSRKMWSLQSRQTLRGSRMIGKKNLVLNPNSKNQFHNWSYYSPICLKPNNDNNLNLH